MSTNLYTTEEDGLAAAFLKTAEIHEKGEINALTAMSVCMHITRLISECEEVQLRELLYQKGALDMLVFRITRMPASRRNE